MSQAARFGFSVRPGSTWISLNRRQTHPSSIAPRVLRFTGPSTSSDTRADVAASLDLFDAIGMVRPLHVRTTAGTELDRKPCSASAKERLRGVGGENARGPAAQTFVVGRLVPLAQGLGGFRTEFILESPVLRPLVKVPGSLRQ